MNTSTDLLSFTETPNPISKDLNPPKKSCFQVKRIFVLLVLSTFEMLVCFQRNCPTVVTDELSKAYNVPVSKLGIFTSMFYYPFSLLQPIAGLMCDVIEPSYILFFSGVITAVGDFICGLSKSLLGGSIGRLFVGFGCSFVASSCIRTILNWFPLEHYSRMYGIFLFFGGVGGILAQTPFTLLARIIGWRWCFYSIAIVSIFFSIITFIFIRGDPTSLGYKAINEYSGSNEINSFKEKCKILLNNLCMIISNFNFWLGAIYVFCENGAYDNIIGIWGGPFLKEILGYDSVKTSNALLGTSIGGLSGSLINPYIIDTLHLSKKWVLVCATLIAALCCIPFGFFPEKLSFIMVVSLFFVLAFTTSGFAAILSPLVLELFPPSAGSSVGGSITCFAFISLIIFMPLTGKILQHFGADSDDPEMHNPDGFKYGLWVFDICALSIGAFLLMFFKNKRKMEPNSVGKYDQVN